MKRFQKALLGVVVSGALLFSAQAAEPPSSAQDTLQSAMTTVQQEIKDYGQVKTLGFSGENCEIILSNLNAKQYLVNLTSDSTHKYGILDKATGKLVVPVEYDYYIALDGTETLVSQYDADHYPNYWFAYSSKTRKSRYMTRIPAMVQTHRLRMSPSLLWPTKT